MNRQRFLVIGTLLAAALLAACNSKTPTAPPASPTPAAYTVALAASPTHQTIGGTVFLTAAVKVGGQTAPDGTSVNFVITGCVPTSLTTPSFENGTCEMVRTTQGGNATATLYSDSTSTVPGNYQVVARAPKGEGSVLVGFSEPVNPSQLAIYSVLPTSGPAAGGQIATIYGRSFATPVTVDFIIGGQTFHAEVKDVNVEASQITVVTPPVANAITQNTTADLTVTAAAGTASPVSDTLSQAYVFEVGGPNLGEPHIYNIVPSRGAWAGGEQVTIYGEHFGSSAGSSARVTFGAEEAQVTSVSADGSQLTVLTPQHSGSINQEQPVDVTVTTNGGTVTRSGGFTYVPDSGMPLLYSVLPNQGSPRGGETVVLTGKNFTQPVNVDFVMGAPLNTTLPAEVVSVNQDATQITLRTPQASPTPVTTDVPVDITITNAVGSANSQSATFSGVFTYVGESRPPIIYYLQPDRGSARGGEQVTISGNFFLSPVQVVFSPGGTAQVVDVSSDGERITIVTPAVSVAPLEQDTPANVTVTTEYGTGRDQSVTLSNGFLYLAEQPTPELFALSPNSGPLEGGTPVTITGQGFQNPVQVLFGDHQAQVTSQNFTTIQCVSPSITPTEPDTPTTVQVTVTNITTGKTSNALPFRYGEAMFISGLVPNEGPADRPTDVVIQGQGFSAPVTVEFSNPPLQWQVSDVSGTEITAQAASIPESARSCSDVRGTVTVTNVNSNTQATSPTFTYRATHPFITSIVVDNTGDNVVKQYVPGVTGCNTPWTTHTITINGSGFRQREGTTQSAMVVSFGGIGPVPTTWVSETQLTATLPDLTAIPLNSTTCIASGQPGKQYIDTPVDVTITNEGNSCSDTLSGALVIRPCDTTCHLAPTNFTVVPPQGTLNGGTPVTLLGNNFICSPMPTIQFGSFATSPATCTATQMTLNTPSGAAAGRDTAGTVQVVAFFGVESSSGSFTYTAQLDATAVPTGAGTVNGTGLKTSQTATLTAVPINPSTFNMWEGDCSSCGTQASCLVIMNADPKTCQADFNPGLTVTLAGNVGGNSVMSSPAGISGCTASCSSAYPLNTVVTLTATASGTWSGDCSGTGTSANVTMDGPKSCTITFP